MVDTHVHLEFPDYEGDRDAVVARARAAGVKGMICVGGEVPRNRMIIGLVEKYGGMYGAVGMHPHWASAHTVGEREWVKEQWGAGRVVAIGEVGLDYHYDYSPRHVQRRVFGEYMALASEVGLPVIIHSREAFEDTIAIVREHGGVRGVVHCFSYGIGEAEALLELGLYISFCGQLTFPKCAEVRAVAAKVPLERLLLETDCPFLAPVPYRGQRNEPAHVAVIAAKHAEVRGCSIDEVVTATTRNAEALFKIRVQ
ncbi:MAG: TatD family hydrolase [bacterium]|nr:TatD family hydrolase [bacterium]